MQSFFFGTHCILQEIVESPVSTVLHLSARDLSKFLDSRSQILYFLVAVVTELVLKVILKPFWFTHHNNFGFTQLVKITKYLVTTY